MCCSFSGLPTEWQTLIKGAISKTEVEQDPNAAVGERPPLLVHQLACAVN
jgi:hypothetical protein